MFEYSIVITRCCFAHLFSVIGCGLFLPVIHDLYYYLVLLMFFYIEHAVLYFSMCIFHRIHNSLWFETILLVLLCGLLYIFLICSLISSVLSSHLALLLSFCLRWYSGSFRYLSLFLSRIVSSCSFLYFL